MTSTAGCIDTDPPASRRTFGQSQKSLTGIEYAHHAMWVTFTETRCKSLVVPDPTPNTRVPRCVLSGSCPQFLDAPLRTIQMPVDQERVGVGRYLRRDPGGQPHQRGGQRLAQAEDPLEAGDGDLYVLPRPVAPFRALGSQEDADLRQGLSQIFASVGQVSQERPRHFLSQSRLGEEFLGQGDVRDVGGGEFVGDGDTVGGAQEVQLYPVDRKGTPAYPPGPFETRRLGNLARMQDFEQGRVHKQGLRFAHQFGNDLPPEGLQKAPELPHTAVQRGRIKPHHAGEQVRKEPLGVPQEGALALHPPQLLEERECDDLRVGKPLERLVTLPVWVEMGVGVVDEAEEDGEGLFRVGEQWGMVGLGHLSLLGEGRLRWPPFYLVPNPRNTHLGGETAKKIAAPLARKDGSHPMHRATKEIGLPESANRSIARRAESGRFTPHGGRHVGLTNSAFS